MNLVANTLYEHAARRRGYFDPKNIHGLLENMRTREFVFCKQVASLVVIDLGHRVFTSKGCRFDWCDFAAGISKSDADTHVCILVQTDMSVCITMDEPPIAYRSNCRQPT